MNLFEMQFFLPAVFYRRNYGREYKNKDAFFAPEWATDNLWQIIFRIGYLLSERGTGVKPLN